MQERLFSVTAAAQTRTLVTLDELRAALGIADRRSDSALQELNSYVAGALASNCNLASDGVTPATFRLETVSDTIELDQPVEKLVLSRRPIVSVVSVTVAGSTLADTLYRPIPGAGMLQRREAGRPSCWAACSEIVVAYTAGWATVPDNLKNAALRLARLFWAETKPGARDPNLKREVIQGATEFEYWVPPTTDPAIPAEVVELLADYRNYPIG